MLRNGIGIVKVMMTRLLNGISWFPHAKIKWYIMFRLCHINIAMETKGTMGRRRGGSASRMRRVIHGCM